MQNIFKIIRFGIVGILCSGSLLLSAQDPHFSQFYASPLTMNPATVGTYDGTFRISTIYRDQWRTAVDNPMSTFSFSGDASFDLRYSKVKNPDHVALGITFFGDRASTFNFNTNQIVLTAGYHKALNNRTNEYLGIAVQGGVLQKSVNYENLTFGDQYDQTGGYTLGTAEDLPVNNRAFTDLSIGSYYSVSPSKKLRYHAGLAYFHFNEPNLSFYNSEDIINEEIIQTDTYYAKWSFHTGASIRTAEMLTVEPRLNLLIQGPHTEANIGSNFRFKIDKKDGKYLHLGPYIRGVKDYNGVGFEALILMAGIEMNNFIIGLSYDQSLRQIIRDRRSLSSFELSLIYIGEHNNEDNFCPQF